MKVLNLYAGIGGNRQLWTDVEVTAVENNESIAAIYQDFFPDDKMILTDAHQYLLEHFKEFDFIWSSPPCPSHSRARFWGSHREDTKYVYPDMDLYQEILFLQNYCSCAWIVENVIPYYNPLIIGNKIGKNMVWSNFQIIHIKIKNVNVNRESIKDMEKTLGISLTGKYPKIRKDKILRNCVLPEFGLHILECARGNYNYLNQSQENLF